MATATRDLEVVSASDEDAAAHPISWRDREASQPLELTGGPSSAVAATLVDRVLADLALPAGPKSREKQRVAIGAVLAGLLKLELLGIPGNHGMSKTHFAGGPVGWDIFQNVSKAMQAAGLLWIKPGFARWHTFGGGKPSQQGGRHTCFRLTPTMIEQVEGHGIELGAWRDHWHPGAPRTAKPKTDVPRLVLKGRKPRIAGVKIKDAPDIPFDAAEPIPAAILTDLEAHNAFLATQMIEGVSFHGLRRIFNDGDQPGFAWRWGGRFYSVPAGVPYENMPGEERRRTLRINGEAVGEADLTASQLTLLYALRGVPFDATSDPYAAPGIPRDIIKLWVAQALGSSSVAARSWSTTAERDYAKLAPERELRVDHPFAPVREAGLALHPILAGLKDYGLGPLDLHFHEAEVTGRALRVLRERHGIPALPIHDGLIVGLSGLEVAREVLREAFSSYLSDELGWSPPAVPSVKLKVAA